MEKLVDDSLINIYQNFNGIKNEIRIRQNISLQRIQMKSTFKTIVKGTITKIKATKLIYRLQWSEQPTNRSLAKYSVIEVTQCGKIFG